MPKKCKSTHFFKRKSYKFYFLLFIFIGSISFNTKIVQVKSADIVGPALTEAQVDELKEGLLYGLKSDFGFFAKFFSKWFVNIVNNITNRVIDWLVYYFEQVKIENANIGTEEQIEEPPIELLFPVAVKQRIDALTKTTIHNLQNSLELHNALFVGPAGTGKTSLAMKILKNIKSHLKKNPVSGVSSVIYYIVHGAEWAKYSKSDLINLARSKQERWKKDSEDHMVIIILDEMEVLFPKREVSSPDRNDFTNTFLTWMGSHKKNIMIIGTTNLKDKIDDAMRRRFGFCVEIPEPDNKQRREMIIQYLIHYLNENPYSARLVFDPRAESDWLLLLADQTEGSAGADFDNMLKKAVEEAASSSGIVDKNLLLKHINEERHKRATFAKKITLEQSIEIGRLLEINETFSWTKGFNIYSQFVGIKLDYAGVVEKSLRGLHYLLKYRTLRALADFYQINTILDETVGSNAIFHGAVLSRVNNILHSYCLGPKISPNSAKTSSEEQTIKLQSVHSTREVPIFGEKFNCIEKISTKLSEYNPDIYQTTKTFLPGIGRRMINRKAKK